MNLSTVNAFKHISSVECVCLDEKQLHQLQQVLLKILDDIVFVCEKYHINYFLGGGTALGAMRHQGFIPWDDDIDINMPRADYETFIPAFQKEYGKKYWVHTPEKTDNYGLLLARVRLKGTCVKTREDFFNHECGAFVDIFIIENTFNNKILRSLHGIGSLAFGLLLSCRKFYRDRKQLLLLAKEAPELKKVFYIKILIGFFTAILNLNTWTHAANGWNSICKDTESIYVSGCAGRLHFFGELYLRKNFCTVKKALFEGRTLRVSQGVEGYLSHCYGNWKKPPEPSQREKHVVFELKL